MVTLVGEPSFLLRPLPSCCGSALRLPGVLSLISQPPETHRSRKNCSPKGYGRRGSGDRAGRGEGSIFTATEKKNKIIFLIRQLVQGAATRNVMCRIAHRNYGNPVVVPGRTPRLRSRGDLRSPVASRRGRRVPRRWRGLAAAGLLLRSG